MAHIEDEYIVEEIVKRFNAKEGRFEFQVKLHGSCHQTSLSNTWMILKGMNLILL